MKNLKSFKTAIAIGIAVLGMTASPAGAAAIYTYTGNPFDIIGDSTPPAGNYTTADSISASFTLPSALAPNSGYADVTGSISSFTVTDGRTTLTNLTPFSLIYVAVSTDGAGLPHEWNFIADVVWSSSPAVGDLFLEVASLSGSSFVTDSGLIVYCESISGPGRCTGGEDYGLNFDRPGVWTRRLTSVPEPSSLLLFGAGLAGIGRRWRSAV